MPDTSITREIIPLEVEGLRAVFCYACMVVAGRLRKILNTFTRIFPVWYIPFVEKIYGELIKYDERRGYHLY